MHNVHRMSLSVNHVLWESSSIGTAAPRVADSSPLPVGPDGGGTPRPPDDNRLSKVDQTFIRPVCRGG